MDVLGPDDRQRVIAGKREHAVHDKRGDSFSRRADLQRAGRGEGQVVCLRVGTERKRPRNERARLIVDRARLEDGGIPVGSVQRDVAAKTANRVIRINSANLTSRATKRRAGRDDDVVRAETDRRLALKIEPSGLNGEVSSNAIEIGRIAIYKEHRSVSHLAVLTIAAADLAVDDEVHLRRTVRNVELVAEDVHLANDDGRSVSWHDRERSSPRPLDFPDERPPVEHKVDVTLSVLAVGHDEHVPRRVNRSMVDHKIFLINRSRRVNFHGAARKNVEIRGRGHLGRMCRGTELEHGCLSRPADDETGCLERRIA